MIGRIDKYFMAFLKTVIILSNLVITALMIFLVVARYILGWSVVGIHETALIFAMWLYMSGSVVASRRSEHLVVDLVAKKIRNPGWLRFHQRFIALIMIITSVFFMFWAWKMLAWSMKRPQTTPALSIPLLVPQSAIMFASVASFVYAVRDFFKKDTDDSSRETTWERS
jgi:TRAP-type transport system small permease protein